MGISRYFLSLNGVPRSRKVDIKRSQIKDELSNISENVRTWQRTTYVFEKHTYMDKILVSDSNSSS